MYTPAQVARRAGVHANSIRNWSRDYAAFLSPAARGANGPRLYSDEDLSVLCAIAALRKSGMSPGDIPNHLQTIPTIELQAPTQIAVQTPQDAPQDTYALQLVYSNLQSRVEALERRVEARAGGLVTGVIIGFALAILLVAVVLWLR